ncbi:MAG: hypothetical protein ACTHOD_19625 [Motilibacteraceae bacterium]
MLLLALTAHWWASPAANAFGHWYAEMTVGRMVQPASPTPTPS